MFKALMLNFETFCVNRPLHNEYGNVISSKRSFMEKSYEHFLLKNKIWVVRDILFLKFFNLNF